MQSNYLKEMFTFVLFSFDCDLFLLYELDLAIGDLEWNISSLNLCPDPLYIYSSSILLFILIEDSIVGWFLNPSSSVTNSDVPRLFSILFDYLAYDYSNYLMGVLSLPKIKLSFV